MRYLGRSSVSSHLSTLFNALWYILIVVGCILALGTVAGTILHLAGAIDLEAIISSDNSRIAFRTPGAEIVFHGTEVQSGLGPFAAMIAGALALVPVALLMLHHLRSLMASFAQSNPFSAENVGRIRWIGYLFMIGAALQSAIEVALGFFLRTLSIPGVEINPRITLDFQVVIAGLVILVLAEIFRLGVELREDHDLTV